MGNKGAKLKTKELKSLVEKTKCAYMLCRTACWCLACWRVQQLGDPCALYRAHTHTLVLDNPMLTFHVLRLAYSLCR